MKRKLLSILLALSLALSLLPTMAWANETTQEAFETAVAGATAGDTITITEAGTYTITGISKNITIKGTDGVNVVFNCTGSGNIGSIPNGATFENVTINLGNSNYHGFQNSGLITMKDCTLNGLLVTYSDMSFDTCTFTNSESGKYNVQIYGSSNFTFTKCTFNGTNRNVFVYQEGLDGDKNISFTNCVFNQTATSKSAVMLNAVPLNKNGSWNGHKYNLTMTNCTISENARKDGAATAEDEKFEYYYGAYGFKAHDDFKKDVEIPIEGKVIIDNKQVYPYVDEDFFEKDGVWHIANEAGLMKFRDSVNSGTSYAGKTISIDADIDLSGENWEAIKAYPGYYLSGTVIKGNNHAIKSMTINTPAPESGYAYGSGFIDKTAGALTVEDLTFEGASVTSANGSQVGVVCGMSYGDVTLKNVNLKDCTVTSVTKTGAYVGQNDNGTVTLTDCDLVNTTVEAEYSFALMVGLLNTNSNGATFSNCSADTNSNAVLTDELKEFAGSELVTIDGYKYAINGGELWLLDPNGAWAEQRVAGQTCNYLGTSYAVVGGKLYTRDGAIFELPKKVAATVVVDPGAGGDEGKTVEVTIGQESDVVTEGEGVAELESEVKTAISDNTTVTGVKLTTTVAEDAGEDAKSGLQAVVDAAVNKQGSAIAADIATAETVNIEVKVNVVPTTFTAPVEATQDAEEVIGTVTFELKPTATVTIGKGEGAKSETVDVDNSMIDTSKPITVSIYTGFKPAKVVHKGDDDFEEVFRETGEKTFTYNETTKVCTLTISHFSTLTALSEDYAAEITIGEATTTYKTFGAALTAAKTASQQAPSTPVTVKLLKDVTISGDIGSGSNKALFNIEDYHNIIIDGDRYKFILNEISNTTNNGGYVFTVRGPAEFKNVTVERQGNWTCEKFGGFLNITAGAVTLTNCNIDLIKANLAANEAWGCFPVNIGSVTGKPGAVVTVNGGTYTGGKVADDDHKGIAVGADTATLIFNDGTTNGIHVEGAKSVEIKGGAHNDRALRVKDGVTGVSVSGGLFTTAPDAKYLAEDYECVENTDTKTKDTYKYVVRPMAPVAKIGEKTYTTLAKAIAAVPTDGTETTITMIADETINTNDGVTVGKDMNVVLDLNGFTIDGPAPEAKTSYIIKIANGGILTVEDNSQEGTGRITAKATGDVNKLYGNYAIDNQGGKFTLESGTIESDDSDTTVKKTGLYWAISTGSYGATAETTINGGTVIGHSYQAVRAYVQQSGSSKLTINGGVIRSETKSPISIQLCDKQSSNFELNITGGTIVSDAGKTPIYAWGYEQSDPNEMDLAISKLSVSGGQFNSGNSVSDVVDWSNSTYGDCDFINAPVKCVSGGLYTFEVSAAQLANGYVCIENPDGATKADYPFIVKAAEVEVAEKATKVNKDGDKADTIADVIKDELAADVKKDVVEKIIENAEETYGSNIQQQIPEGTKVDVVNKEDPTETVEVTLSGSSKTRIDVKLESLQVNIGTEKASPTLVTECTVTTKTATYDVKPVVTVTTTNGETGETEVETLVITNEWLKENNKVLTFTLPVPVNMTGDSVLVKHIKEDKTEETFNARVETDEKNNRFITITATEFSTYELSQQTEEGATAKIENGGKIYYYSSLANAVSDAQNNDTIILLKDSETGAITVDREVSFTLKLNGKALKANIVAGEDYTLSRSGNTYTVTKYVAPTYSGGGATTYAVTAESAKNGKLTVDKKTASSGSTVTITVTPDKGFTLETLTVLDKNGKEIEVKNLGNNKFSFKMPSGKVTVEATFMEDNTMLNFFVDVKASDYYYDAVLWAAENGITQGTDAVHFSPNLGVTRAQVVTFLWRAAGSPEPKGDADKFTDLLADQYYLKAVAWAIEQGITKGVTDTTFEPETVCTRGQIVTFLARFAGVEDTETESVFADVPASEFFAAAVKWAKDNGVTSGVTETTFEPYTNCNRAQVVTFLYRWMVK